MDSPEYCEINSNITLNYINQILMEESTDDKVSIYQSHDALKAMEKPFYDILGQEYPYSPKETMTNSDSQPDCSGCFVRDILGPKSVHLTDDDWISKLDNFAMIFNRSAEEAKKLVPSIEKLVIDPKNKGILVSKQKADATIGQKSKHINKIRSHPSTDLELLEGRNGKHLAISTCEIIRDEMFDSVLLCDWQLHQDVAHLKEMKEKETNNSPQNVRRKGHEQGQKIKRDKKQQNEAVDLRALLIQCAQALASTNRPFATELLKKVRYHSSPYGDGSQRLAFYFADGLEARLAGTGSQIYQKLMVKRTSATDMLKAYRLFIAACPFARVAYHYSNQTIADVLEGKPSVHIIDFGILFGFQWPSLIQRFAKREGGPPKVRITGINVPETGFRPCKKIEETERRLAEYAEMFNVPFQFQGITSRWENICIEDLNIDKEEVLIINCLHHMQKLADETEDIDSARDRVLRIMKSMNPEVLIIGIVNGMHNSPFFLPRFREVLFYFSSLFDMLNTTVGQSHEARILIERDLFGADVLNVVACEGAERIERPESYKQWQVRSLKAGFKQRRVNQTILNRSIEGKKELYHEDFVINEDSGWLLQGWKGRIIHALSSWQIKES